MDNRRDWIGNLLTRPLQPGGKKKLSNWLRIYKADTSIGHWQQGHLLVAYRRQIVESFLEDI